MFLFGICIIPSFPNIVSPQKISVLNCSCKVNPTTIQNICFLSFISSRINLLNRFHTEQVSWVCPAISIYLCM
uniref:Uncharacterized protein n=1 Tax=Rhizophora mucronata TaxID=61149 RepID=A0A2P2NVF3_RHIMU